ncbi:MAG: hypothetical protein Tsb005_19160 [Gammaproteobacteria bacterium]
MPNSNIQNNQNIAKTERIIEQISNNDDSQQNKFITVNFDPNDSTQAHLYQLDVNKFAKGSYGKIYFARQYNPVTESFEGGKEVIIKEVIPNNRKGVFFDGEEFTRTKLIYPKDTALFYTDGISTKSIKNPAYYTVMPKLGKPIIEKNKLNTDVANLSFTDKTQLIVDLLTQLYEWQSKSKDFYFIHNDLNSGNILVKTDTSIDVSTKANQTQYCATNVIDFGVGHRSKTPIADNTLLNYESEYATGTQIIVPPEAAHNQFGTRSAVFSLVPTIATVLGGDFETIIAERKQYTPIKNTQGIKNYKQLSIVPFNCDTLFTSETNNTLSQQVKAQFGDAYAAEINQSIETFLNLMQTPNYYLRPTLSEAKNFWSTLNQASKQFASWQGDKREVFIGELNKINVDIIDKQQTFLKSAYDFLPKEIQAFFKLGSHKARANYLDLLKLSELLDLQQELVTAKEKFSVEQLPDFHHSKMMIELALSKKEQQLAVEKSQQERNLLQQTEKLKQFTQQYLEKYPKANQLKRFGLFSVLNTETQNSHNLLDNKIHQEKAIQYQELEQFAQNNPDDSIAQVWNSISLSKG